MKKICCKVLVLVGSDERCVSARAIDRWVLAAAAINPSLIFYNRIRKARHELLSEIPEIYLEVLDNLKIFI